MCLLQNYCGMGISMSEQNSINGEIREQNRKMKDMTLKGKLSHLWTYYKFHAAMIIVAVIIIAYLAHHFATYRETRLYAILVNAYVPEDTGTAALTEEFEEYSGIDRDKYQVYFDTSFNLSDKASYETGSTNEKLATLLYAKTPDVLIANTSVFEYYAQREYFADLEQLLPEEVLDEYKDYLYYTDAATFIDETDINNLDSTDEAELFTINRNDDTVINHHDPSGMEEPVLVGIAIPEDSGLYQTGYYDYLAENGSTYQGYQSEPVMGIFVYTENLDMALKLLEF